MGSWAKNAGSKFDKYLDGRRHRISMAKFPNHKDLNSVRTSLIVIANRRGIKIATSIDKEKNILIVTPKMEGN